MWSAQTPMGQDGAVAGAIVLAMLIVVVFPILVSLGCAAIAAGLGWSLKSTGEDLHPGSELIELNQ